MLAAESIHAALALRLTRGGRRARGFPAAACASRGCGASSRGRATSAPGIAKFGTLLGGALAFVEQNLLRGRVAVHAAQSDRPTTRGCVRAAATRRRSTTRSRTGSCRSIALSSVFLSSTAHDEDQPAICSSRTRPCRSRRICRCSTSPRSVIARRASMRSSADAAGAAAVPHQRRELRALQDLRHQGSGAEHHLGAAGRRRRAQLLGHA